VIQCLGHLACINAVIFYFTLIKPKTYTTFSTRNFLKPKTLTQHASNMTAQPAANIATHFAALPLNQAAIRHEVMDAVHEAMAASVRYDGSPAPAKHTCIPWKDALHIHYKKISNAGLSPSSEEAAQYRLVETVGNKPP